MYKQANGAQVSRFALFVAATLFTTSALGASLAGLIDPLGTQGTPTQDFPAHSNDRAQAVAIQSDGKIVVAGYATNSSGNQDFAVLRYDNDGTLDTTFHSSGMVTTDFGNGDDVAEALVIQPDGSIVVAGYATNASGDKDFAVARYTTDGTLDTTFNAGGAQPGTLLTDFSSADDFGKAMALQLDGKIVVAGYSFNGTKNVFAVARYNPDGTPDTTFHTDGTTTTSFIAGTDDRAYAVAAQVDGKIVVSGYTTENIVSGGSSTNDDFALARYNDDGSLDVGFGAGSPQQGTVTTPLGSRTDETYALVVQPDGKIVVAGRTENTSTARYEFALARYQGQGSLAGALDTGFGQSGVATAAIGTSSNDEAHALALQPDGKLIAAGLSVTGATESMALARFTPGGALDTTFNAGGANGARPGTAVLTFNSSVTNEAHALALQPADQIVVAGFTNSTSTNDDFAVARYFAADDGWGLAPSGTIGFTNGYASPGDTVTSDLLTMAGLGSATCAAGVTDCVTVPVTILGGQYAKNGATAYSAGFGWAQNGEQFNVQQTIPSNTPHGGTTTTTLVVGGLVAANNYTVVLGTITPYEFISTADTPPKISGTPATTVQEGNGYTFTPTASDPDGDTPLEFTIANAPTWARFDPTTGTLSGTPTAVDVGTSGDIRISVRDAIGATTSLPPFSIAVTSQPAPGGGGGGGSGGGSGALGPLSALLLLCGAGLRRRTARATGAAGRHLGPSADISRTLR